MKQEKWAERLEQHLADYQKSPSHDLWEGIEAGLDKASKRQARIVMIRRWITAAAFIGVVSGGAILFWNRQQDRELSAQNDLTETSAQVKTTEKMTPFNDNIADKFEETNSASKTFVGPLTEKKLIVENHSDHTQDKQDIETEQQKPDTASVKPSSEPSVVFDKHENPLTRAFGRATKRQHSHLLAMNVYVSGRMNSLERRNGVQMSQEMLQEFALTRGRDSDSPVYLFGYEERQSHDLPISLGLTFSYPLTDRLSIGTGVVYTKLNSDFTNVMLDNQVCRHQTLHYVGIPLNVQFALWQWRGLNIYLSGGGQVDWNVEAKINIDGIDQKINKDRMQWSIGGGLGVQYNILPQFGLYAEPGIRHYFDNGSNVSNFFKEKPTDFHLELGLRFKW